MIYIKNGKEITMYKIGVLGAADIAYRMFIPALKKSVDFECIGIAEEYNTEKLQKFKDDYGLNIFHSFDDLINNPSIDVLYIPLPPALHYEYAKKALLNGKHVFLEKPLTTKLEHTEELISIAKSKNLVLQENYMFQFHHQLDVIKNIISSKKLGEIRLIRSCFSFPKRAQNDFRYSKKLGGGALLDAGGYVIKLGTLLLGDDAKINDAHLYSFEDYDVDIFGDFTMSNGKITYQGAFGMDNVYTCSLEVYGSKGKLYTNRIFTSPPENKPILILMVENQEEIIVDADNHFLKSILKFKNALENDEIREELYITLFKQTQMLMDLKELGERYL